MPEATAEFGQKRGPGLDRVHFRAELGQRAVDQLHHVGTGRVVADDAVGESLRLFPTVWVDVRMRPAGEDCPQWIGGAQSGVMRKPLGRHSAGLLQQITSLHVVRFFRGPRIQQHPHFTAVRPFQPEQRRILQPLEGRVVIIERHGGPVDAAAGHQ